MTTSAITADPPASANLTGASQPAPTHLTGAGQPAPAGAPGPTDPRPGFARALATARSVVAGVRAGQLEGPTPCTDFDVRTLLGHLTAVLHRVAAVGRGQDPFSVAQISIGIDDEGWDDAFAAAAAEVEAVWANPAVLERLLKLPFGTLPGAVALAVYTGEVTTHSWDLAVATGQEPDWDAEVVAHALAAAQRALAADRRGPEVPFGAVVAVRDGAPLIEQLAGWQGRDPAWTPGTGPLVRG